MSSALKMFVCTVALPVMLAASGCSKTDSPTDPTPGPGAGNRAPTIASATVTPASGYAAFTSHSFSASATDPDGDALTFTWDFGNGTSGAGASTSVTYTNANTTTYQPVVTVRDSNGASTTSTVSVTSATMSGTFNGTLLGSPVTVTLTQFLGGVVTGTWTQPTGARGDVGPTGEPGKLQANGQFELRFKVLVGSFVDFYFRGQLSADGRQLVGSLTGSGFSGETLILTK